MDLTLLKCQIEDAMRCVKESQTELYRLKKLCTHRVVKKYESAICDVCDRDFGWYCSESPDHACHYHSENLEDGSIGVELVDGSFHLLHNDHDPNGESWDWCIFCGDPEERK